MMNQLKKQIAGGVISLTIVLNLGATSALHAQKNTNVAPVLPSAVQKQWAEAEIGAMFHFDMPNFVPGYKWRNWGSHPQAAVFNPSDVDTDQWIAAAKSAGAKYAVLVAKHCSGFSLWPTAAHDYSVKNSPWKKGQGDIVKDFIASCKKYGLRPGIYASASANGYLWVNNPGKVQPGGPVDQKTYNDIVMKQLTELWSNYGKLFEIWFDGGTQLVSEGGPDIAGLLEKLQPGAVVFQGPSTSKNLLRWIGNEDGLAPYPNWSTTNVVINANGTLKQEELAGNPDGKIWCPAETDFPIRSGWQGGWFWKASDQKLMSKEQLMQNYLTSVGRNSNMLIGIVVDTSGHVPKEDVALLKDFGDQVKQQFASPLATVKGKGNLLELDFGGKSKQINGVVIREDLSGGERVRKYEVEALVGKEWVKINEGTAVGNKRIAMVSPVIASKVRLKISASIATPLIKQFAALAQQDVIRPGEVWNDVDGKPIQVHGGGVTKHKDTYYWYGDKGAEATDLGSRNVNCYISTDLMNWKLKGIALKIDGLDTLLGDKWVLERPKVYYNAKTRKFVMYMHLDGAYAPEKASGSVVSDYTYAHVGVAVSDRPEGPFKYVRAFRPLGRESRDIGQFIDDDGTAYLIFEDRPSGGFHIAKLSEDYLDVIEDVCLIKAPLEGGAIVRYDGMYYVIGSYLTGWEANPNKYATAKSLKGPWSEFKDIAPPETNTYNSQSAMLFKVTGTKATSVIFMGDKWKNRTPYNSGYLWMPLEIGNGTLRLPEPKPWSIDVKTGKVTYPEGLGGHE